MPIRTIRRTLEDVLPGTVHAGPDIGRLTKDLRAQPGVLGAHVIQPPDRTSRLCVHFSTTATTPAAVAAAIDAAAARLGGHYGTVVVPIRAITTEDGHRRLTRQLQTLPGVYTATVSLPAQHARLDFDSRVTSSRRLSAQVRRSAFGAAGPPAAILARHRELLLSAAAGVLLLTGWVSERSGAPDIVHLALYAGALACGGFDLLRQTLGEIVRRRFEFDIDLLMLLAAAGAVAIGEYAEGALLLFLFSLAHAAEHYALGRARHAIAALGELAPAFARVLRDDGTTELVAVDLVAPGTRVLVRPGDRVPVDGTVERGTTGIDQAPVTGESVPVEKGPGDDVFAGTVNGEGAIEVVTTRAPGDRTLDRIIKLVAEAQTEKAPTEQLTDRFARVFVPLVLVGDALLIVVPPLVGLWDWPRSIYTGMATLVAASPCALALGTPASVVAGIARAARLGVLIKGGAHLEALASIGALAVDKTGTITIGRPDVTEVQPIDGTRDDLLRLSAAVEAQSSHPLADAIVRAADAAGLTRLASSPIESITARGARATVDGRVVGIGSLRMWDADEVPGSVRDAVGALEARGRSVVVVRAGGRWLGVIGVADRPRPDVAQVLTRLRRLGVRRIAMLTGDNPGVGNAIAREVGIDEVHANLLPEEKVDVLRRLRRRYGNVAMVGDGVNDAPALAQASVGIAMGAAGTAAALEAADVALMNDDIGQLVAAVGLARRTRVIIRQNIGIALTVIALLMLATTTGLAGLGVAVAFHEGSTLVVIANALRLLAYTGD